MMKIVRAGRSFCGVVVMEEVLLEDNQLSVDLCTVRASRCLRSVESLRREMIREKWKAVKEDYYICIQ